ncbi:MAG TPA: CHAT domain-containing tetratricopeptide repeat protein, partial [Stellaceae bacterium]|nr:CHAT domain-containing tetratricopeptide repeat protein [Stellaceae bacterium]
LGRFYNSTQNFAGAEDAFRRATEIETKVLGPDAEGVGSTLIELALQVSNQGRFDEADALFRRADPIVQRSASDRLHARYISYLALDAANERKYPEALAFARQATAIRRKLAASDTAGQVDVTAVDPQQLGARGELVHSLRIEAAMALRTGDTGSALASISEALELMSSTTGLPLSWRPEALALLSEVDAADGRYAAAKRDLDGAVALSQKLFGPTAPTALVLIKRGHFQTDIDRDADAVRDFHAAFEIIAKDDAARAQLVADSIIPFFTAANDLGGKDPQQRSALADDMFRAGQSIGSGVADQTIGRAAARLFTSDPQIADLIRQTQEAERERDTARLELANEQSKPDAERGSVKEAALAKTVQDQTAQADALQKKLLTAFPAYANLAQPGPVGLAELQQRIAGNEAFLAIVVGHEASYAMLVRHDNFAVHRVEVTESSLTDTVTSLRQAVSPRLGTLPDFDLQASYDLYRKLLAPFDDRLAGVTHLIVAPSGALASLPFALLVTAPPPGAHAYTSAHWLIERMAVSEVPSPRSFVNLREARAHAKPAPHPFLGVGNPTFTGREAAPGPNGSALDALAGACRTAGPVSPELIRALAPLPESADEVRRVGARLGADSNAILLGPAATEANLRRQALGDYNVLYFATHGLLPGELRCESEPGLALSPPDGPSTSGNDGLLDASEVAGLSLNADLVVLSACNTAAGGGRFGGDALSGLAEAFFYAGARTLVASHWQVPSLATVQLMTGMFDRAGPRLQAGIAESLRQSQLALAREPATAHPFYWAAFTVIGDGGAPPGSLSAQALNQGTVAKAANAETR